MDSPVAVPTKERVRIRVQELFDRNLYRQALDAGEQAWGPFRQWEDPDARLLAARIVYQLGLYRTSIALVFATWRKHPDLPSVRYAWVRALFNHRGPFAALCEHDRIGPVLCPEPRLQANWIALRAMIYGAYRDWERAHVLVEEAAALVDDPGEYNYERSWLQHQQDQYPEALALVEPLAMAPGKYQRLAVQRTAALYQLLGRESDAIALLQDGVSRFESVDLAMQLHGMLTDRERFAEAEALLERVRQLVPGGETWFGESIRGARFELAYQRGNIDEAIAILDGVRGRYFRTVRDNLVANRHTGTQRVLDVPFIRQHHMTCAPATFAAVSRYHGRPVDHLELAEAICYDGTPALAERRWIAGNGWVVREFELNLPDIVTLIDAGCPTGFVTVEPGSAHMQAIIGYDTRRGIYLLRDPFSPRVQEILIDGAHEAYASSGPRCMVFVPPERGDWLVQLPLRHADVYDRYYRVQAALDANDREAALREVHALEQETPAHRLALWARRSLAEYDNDPAASLAAVDRLLERYPDDLNLLVSRARLLGDLGKQRERLVFLEACRARGIEHPYLLQALADQLAQDHRRQQETRALLAAIFRRQPTSAAALWTLAGVHWDLGERERAFEYYRLCICVEDKIERYADSYFRAARHLRLTGQVLDYLRRRVDLLGARSPNPYITLARSLEELGRSHDARAVLEAALERHPRDEWLLLEAFDAMLAAGDDQRAGALLDSNGAALSAVSRLRKQAALAEFRGAYDQQLALYREILALQPNNHRAIVDITGLLARLQSPEAAIAFIDGYLDASPFNRWLMREKLDQVERLPCIRQEVHLAAMSERHPDDIYLLSARARVLLDAGSVEEALALTARAISIDSDEAWLHIRHGEALVAANRLEEAREAYRRAIALRVDADGVFEALVSTWPTFEGRREALAFIHGELMRQVSFGNGILEFQQIARRYLEDAQVAQFLEDAVRLRPDLWQSWVALALFRVEINHPAEALLAADEAVARFPLIPRVWMERAGVLRVLDRIDPAIQDLRQALSINPRYATCSTRLVDLLELTGDLDAALAELDRAQRLAPRFGAFYGYRAALLWRRGDREAAVDTLVEGLRIAPFYGWGWDTLVEWVTAMDCQERARALGLDLAEAHPGSGELWKRCADVAEERAEKAALLEKAIACDTRNIDFLKARCGLYVDEGDIAAARALIERNFSGAEKPTEIRAYEAWLTASTGRRKEAIRAMEQVVADDPAYYSGWRLLARWYDEEQRRDDCLRAARMLVQLYPQSSAALVAAGEYFISHAGDDKSLVAEAREYFERALRLQHGDVYSFLTLVDLYFDDGNHAAIQSLFARQLVDERDPYVCARRVRLLLVSGRHAEALDAAMAMYAQVPDNNWLLFEPYAWFEKAGQGAALRARLFAAVHDPATPVRLGRLWIRALIDDVQQMPTRFCERLAAAEREMPAAIRLEGIAWLLGQRHDYPALVDAMLFRWGGRLQDEPAVWPALVYAAVTADNWSEVRRLSAHAAGAKAAKALYYCSTGWRMTSDLALARQFAGRAAALPEDDSRDNLRFWNCFDAWLGDPGAVDRDVLGSIDLRELTAPEKFLYDLLTLLLDSPSDPQAIDVAKLARDMREARKTHGGIVQHAIARRAWLRAWWALCRRGGGGWRRVPRCTALFLAFIGIVLPGAG